MITSALLYLIYFVILGLTLPLRILSDVVPDANLTAGITYASGLLASVSPFLPIGTLLTILGIFIAYEVIIGSYRIIMWVLKKIPFIN